MMKIKFKHQPFQLEAVKSVVDVFQGQPNKASKFTLDKGKRQKIDFSGDITTGVFDELDYGFNNHKVELHRSVIIDKLRKVQQRNLLKQSDGLIGDGINLTLEMETGTGKTYTYIRTMYELYKNYGWSKFIVVVPSIAIREGVLKTFQITEDHFMAEYGSKARYFVYNSKQLHHIEKFASDAGINVMIINSQGFPARGQDARRIYMELDDFNTRKPIDVIASTNPILIIDEPQSVEGPKTKESLKNFKPLLTLRYSATHKEEYNKVYRLDALDAYNMKLVKKIGVIGITSKGASGTDSYLYLEGIDISSKHPPVARLDFEVSTPFGLKRKTRKIHGGDNLYELSNQLEQYKGYTVADINAQTNSISFTNGVTLYVGDVQGDMSELQLRRIQIRETIKSHLEKERVLYNKAIKVLSLFFIDEVAKYRKYDKDNEETNGIYTNIFEEEYNNLVEEQQSLFTDEPYLHYLNQINTKNTHKGYFSIDKKSKRLIDPKVGARETDSDDSDAYDLIMRDKERLLSFEEDTRFIFSHSALKEGWDNPNVFQICTLKQSDSTTKKRQEVGRGLRLCVNNHGERIDDSMAGVDVHEINRLTVIASDSYEQFAKDLQREIAETLSDRPRKADKEFFINKVVHNDKGEKVVIDDDKASSIYFDLVSNKYIDKHGMLTDRYFQAVETQQLEFSEELTDITSGIVQLIKTVFVEGKSIVPENENAKNITIQNVNANFHKDEFQKLWKQINKKSIYTVQFDSQELIRNCILKIDLSLEVPHITFTVTDGTMDKIASKGQLKAGEAFKVAERRTEQGEITAHSSIKYDLIGKLMDETKLTRRTIVSILKGIREDKFHLFKRNPEEFIIRTARLINEQKAATIIKSITYDTINDTYHTDIFTSTTLKGTLGINASEVKKHIYDHVITDSRVEQKFASDLDVSSEVQVFAKLPRGFFIPTPVGNYNPDWAIVFKEGSVKHIYFIAETKGSLDSMELREIEKAKIECARKHFAKLDTENLKYDVVNNYERLLELVTH